MHNRYTHYMHMFFCQDSFPKKKKKSVCSRFKRKYATVDSAIAYHWYKHVHRQIHKSVIVLSYINKLEATSTYSIFSELGHGNLSEQMISIDGWLNYN